MTSSTSLPSLTVEEVAIDDLRPDPANPRRISDEELDALERSLRQFGFVQPVLARRENQTVIGGHQRLVAARRLGLTSVPVIYLDLTPEQARLLGLALNKISGSWDDVLLARLLADLQATPDLDLSLSGFGEDEVKDLLRSLETRERRERPEAFDLEEALEEARRAPRTKPGDLWTLGDHRLLCGDATSAADVARLLDGAAPTLLATDPPYGVSLDGSWRDGVYNALGPAETPYMRSAGHPEGDDATRANGGRRGRTAGHRHTTLSGDTRVDWSEAFALAPSLQVGYIWHAGVHAAEVAEGLVAIGFEIVAQVIWDKGLFAIGRSWYHWNHEPCWVVRKQGAKVPFRGSRDQATIWRVPSPKMIMGGSTEPRLDHPTQKPLVLFETPIANHLRAGGAVYDPFCGSGTALIAAERTGCRAYGMEIDPLYVEVALRRWERFSGRTAERLDG
ncbi:MAG TPA: ParB N-terminal domain-containing protein [Patescibacteria group bacterium]|nr:ParB N-terminal domain-containing protein [Patescibacteria group bacterium]